jgi:HAD domain in Swiss Army Knife RNA repair proteins
MRIFLDFDGVLRRHSSPKSKLDADCVKHLQAAVLSDPDVRLVITSTWRLVHRIDGLRRLFSPELAARIEGVTPDLPEVDECVRHAEILEYLAHNERQGTPWVAVDDDAGEYRPGAPLLLVNPAVGFDAACAERLREWLEAVV